MMGTSGMCSYLLLLRLLPLFFNSSLAMLNSNAFLADQRCSLLFSGSLAQQVRSAFFSCEQGALLWENPSGALLATFSLPRDFHREQGQICLRFAESLPEGTTVERIAHSQLVPMPIASGHSPQCFSLQPLAKLQLFIKTGKFANHSIGLYYAMEEVAAAGEKPTCGHCSQTAFLEAFCSANFVFTGKLLEYSLQANSLHFSAESPLIRRPLVLTHISRANAQFNSTVLFCPSTGHSPQLRPSLHTKYVVLANVRLGFARLLCLLELDQFRLIPREGAPCDITWANEWQNGKRVRQNRVFLIN